MSGKRALVIVDLQRDFCAGGALAVRRADEIVNDINDLVDSFSRRSLPIVFTRDWHPSDHCSFKSEGGTWPVHCVKNTPGAAFHPSLKVPNDALIISKATRPEFEAYSGFDRTPLAEQLIELEADALYVGGLTTDYCVKNTVLDALRLGFKTYLLVDCVRGVNEKKTDSANAFRQMIAKGAVKITSRELLRLVDGRVAVSSSS